MPMNFALMIFRLITPKPIHLVILVIHHLSCIRRHLLRPIIRVMKSKLSLASETNLAINCGGCLTIQLRDLLFLSWL